MFPTGRVGCHRSNKIHVKVKKVIETETKRIINKKFNSDLRVVLTRVIFISGNPTMSSVRMRRLYCITATRWLHVAYKTFSYA